MITELNIKANEFVPTKQTDNIIKEKEIEKRIYTMNKWIIEYMDSEMDKWVINTNNEKNKKVEKKENEKKDKKSKRRKRQIQKKKKENEKKKREKMEKKQKVEKTYAEIVKCK